MRAALALLALAVAILVTRPAAACPPPPPGETCHKYDRHPVDVYKPPPPPAATIYFRDRLGKLPRGAKRLMRHLTGAIWHNEDQTNGDAPIQLFDGSDIPDVVDLDPAARAVIIRGIAKVHGRYQVTMDNGVFAVRRCREDGQITTCLVLVGDARVAP